MGKWPRIDVSVDAVVFYKEKKNLFVLLIKRRNAPFKGKWALPGGFVEIDEALEEAVKRELMEETGLKAKKLKQLHTFSDPKRDPRKRVVSTAYYGIVKKDKHEIKGADDADEAKWFSVKKLPKLAFDHGKMVETALKKVRKKE